VKLHDIKPQATVGAAFLGLVALYTVGFFTSEPGPILSREQGIKYRVENLSLKKLKEHQRYLKKEIPRLEKGFYKEMSKANQQSLLKQQRQKLRDVEEAIRRKKND
jgi:hypothetical protein